MTPGVQLTSMIVTRATLTQFNRDTIRQSFLHNGQLVGAASLCPAPCDSAAL